MKVLSRVLESIVAHSRGMDPFECCGVLLSRPGDPDRVDDVIPAENAEELRPEDSYSLGHRAHLRAVDLEISGKARISGYYHSHPRGGIEPSDRDALRAVEGTAYLIVSGEEERERCAAWRRRGGEFLREPLEVIE